MHKIAAVLIFATAFLISANAQVYIQSLRIGIYEYHIFLPIIPLQIALVLATGNWRKPHAATLLYILWWVIIFLVIIASLLFVDAGTAAVSKASQIVSAALISISFLLAAQHPSVAKAGLLGIAAAVIAASGVSLAEFIDPSFNMVVDQRYETRTLEDQVQRVGGLHVNPNMNASIMVLGMFAAAFLVPLQLRLIFCIVVGAAIFTTVSRSGILSWVLAMTMLTMLGQFSMGKLMTKVLGIFVAITLTTFLISNTLPDILESAGLDELMTDNMVERLSSNFFTQDDGSTSSRKNLVMAAGELYSQHPILGSGLNSATQLGEWKLTAHNTVMDIAAELGTLGVLAYLSIILIVVYFKSTKAAGFLVLFFFQNMFIDGLLNKSALSYILPAGVVLLIQLDQKRLSSQRRKYRKKKQNRKSAYRFS